MPYSPQNRIKNQNSWALSSYKFSNSYQRSEDFDCTSMCVMHQQKHDKRPRWILQKRNHNRISERSVSVRNEEKMEAVRAFVVEDPDKSYRKRVQALLMIPSSMLKILKKTLSWLLIKCTMCSNLVWQTKQLE